MKSPKIRGKLQDANFCKELKIDDKNTICLPRQYLSFSEQTVKKGLSNKIYIASAATSREEIGNPVYPPARAKLAAHGISCAGKRARQMTRQDYTEYDYLIGMDTWNIRNMTRIAGGDPQHKIFRLLSGSDDLQILPNRLP